MLYISLSISPTYRLILTSRITRLGRKEESWDLEMDKKQNREQFKGQPRLPKLAIPKRYDLYLKLDLSACTFSGLVHVNLSIVETTKLIVLNACELVVHQVFFTNSLNHVSHTCLVILRSDRCLI